MTKNTEALADELTRPIIGIENRTAQEVFDIMADRFRSFLRTPPSPVTPITEEAGWQPIETAPRDGTPFLAWCDAAFGEISGFAATAFATVLSGEPDNRSDAGKRYPGLWWSDSGDYYACWSRPTHWRPLPAPPTTPTEEPQS